MHGSPKAILVIKRKEDMMPDFSGPSYLMAKKKMVHGSCPEHDCPGGDDCPHGDEKDDAYASKSMSTDDTYDEPEEMEGHDEGDADPPMDDMDIDAKLKQMKQMATEMMEISKQLEKASKMHKGQADKLKEMAGEGEEDDEEDPVGGASLRGKYQAGSMFRPPGAERQSRAAHRQKIKAAHEKKTSQED